MDDEPIVRSALRGLPPGLSDERLCRIAGQIISRYDPNAGLADTRETRVLVPPTRPLALVYPTSGPRTATDLPAAS